MQRSLYRKLPHEVAFYFGTATPLALVSAIPTDIFRHFTDSFLCIIPGRLSCHRSGILMDIHFLTDVPKGLVSDI